jgi:hypothetical protein
MPALTRASLSGAPKQIKEGPMSRSVEPVSVYCEAGKKRVFACAVDWPGWCRGGRDEAAALQSLLDAGPRYAGVLHAAGIPFQLPGDRSAFAVVERIAGNATTDFGAPDVAPAVDRARIDAAELGRFEALLRAYWQAFDTAVAAAAGKELRKGPRGGGRDVDAIVAHVMGAEQGYLRRIAWKPPRATSEDVQAELHATRQAVLEGLAAAARGELPTRGPRGGAIWPPRFFVRRLAWHVLDHAWEIEDRAA